MTVKLVNTLGNNFDGKVLQWMDALARIIESKQEVGGVTNSPLCDYNNPFSSNFIFYDCY